MYNTLYTHGTDISFNHTHMHNKMLCTSKIGFNFCSKLNTDWLSTTLAWCSGKDSTEARVGGHACEVSISFGYKELKPFFIKARHPFGFSNSSCTKRDTKVLCFYTEVKLGRAKGKRSRWRKVSGAIHLQQEDVSTVRHRQRKCARSAHLSYPKKPSDRFVSWRWNSDETEKLQISNYSKSDTIFNQSVVIPSVSYGGSGGDEACHWAGGRWLDGQRNACTQGGWLICGQLRKPD